MAEETKRLRAARDAALALLARLVEVTPAYQALNDQARALQGDFAGYKSPIDGSVHVEVVALIDAALGDDLGSYFLNECLSMQGGGSIQEDDGRIWPLQTVADLQAYVERHDPPNG